MYHKLKQLWLAITNHQGDNYPRSPNSPLQTPIPLSLYPETQSQADNADEIQDLKRINQQLRREIAEREQVEQVWRERAAYYRNIVENANSLILRIDTQGTITFLNEFAQQFLGYPEAEIRGRSAVETIIPETETSGRDLTTLIQDIIQHPDQYRYHENENIRRDGSRVWVGWTNKALIDGSGQVTGILCIGHDITERHLAQDALRLMNEQLEQRVAERTAALTVTNEQLRQEITERQRAQETEQQLIASLQAAKDQLQAILDAVPGCVSWMGTDLKYQGVNSYLAKTFGLSAAAFVGKELGFMNSTPGFKDFIAQFFASPLQEAKREIETLIGDNCRYYLLVAQKYQQGQAAVCVSVDITELKRTEEALRLSEEKFAKAFRCCPNSITISTLADGRYIEVNETFMRYSGYERQEVIGRTAEELNIWVHPDDRDRMVHSLQQHGAITNQEYEFRTKSGEILIGLLSAEIIRLKGEPCLLALTHDITQRKLAEQRLKESEVQYRAIFEATTDGLIISDLDGQLVEANPAACQMHGYSYSEFIHLDPERFIHPDSHSIFYEYLTAVRQGVPFQREAVDLRSDGTPFPIEVRGTGFMYKGKPHLLAVVRDITEQKQAEARLREAAERDRLLGEIAARIRRSLDLNEIMNTTVAEVRQFLQADWVLISYMDGMMHGKVVAESVADNFPSCWDLAVENDEYLQELIALFEHTDVQVINDTALWETSPESAEYLVQFQVRAALAVAIVVDEQMYGLLVAHQCTSPRQWQPLEVDLLRRLATQVAIAIKQGRLYQQLSELNTNLEHQVEERTAQLQQKMQELQELNQLKDVFLHAVSHDLRTPVMGMLMVLKNVLNSYSFTENQEPRPNDQGHQTIPVSRSIVERMIQSSDRQLNLINSLLEIHAAESYGIPCECEPLQLSQLIQEILTELQPLLAKNQVTLTNQVPDDLPFVSADAKQLWRVFENIITNAMKHNPPGIHLTLSATVVEDTVEGEKVRCAIADNGVGMEQQQCDRLFDLYYRGASSRSLSGIGLGLYLCRQIIKAHGGEIGVISSPGEGTTFWFTLLGSHGYTNVCETFPKGSPPTRTGL